MRIDKLLNERTPKKDVPTSLGEIYNDTEIMAEWDSFYPNEQKANKIMEDYRANLKKRNILARTTKIN